MIYRHGLLLVLTAAANLDIGSALPQDSTRPLSQLAPHSFLPDASHGKGLWHRLRDQVIQNIWSIPGEQSRDGASTRPRNQVSRPPPNLLARYGGDVVLRFKLKTVEEAKALAEASNTLFLDIWEFNEEWVDVRLSKAVV